MNNIYLFIQSVGHSISQFFRNEYKRFKRSPKALLKAIENAKQLNRKTGKHYKVYFLENKYVCMTRLQVQRAKHDNQFRKNINVTKLSAIAFFDTYTGFVSGFAYDLLLTKYSQKALIRKAIVKNPNE